MEPERDDAAAARRRQPAGQGAGAAGRPAHHLSEKERAELARDLESLRKDRPFVL